ncbi:GNAT family N-acetyltransferase [Pseudoponticoccus marisrubri]|uniref:N-acetyltransferase domain-containing protein n=1 Tax=Pseudoponticoccus marisrubri TaxID=1685382 RepID=A0A0W7WQF2_9RHOB|nr:GNAT family N-acetyltransferase [Pseudoponticoccus marisrubri]KUF12712.1 hypothetical protein AVJ23_03075 [Pseudoponticoccus marisrubri]
MMPGRFETARLCVTPWGPRLSDGAGRAALEVALARLLSPAVTAHLPPALHPGTGAAAMAEWIAARRAESEVFLVEDKATGQLLGLLILAGGEESKPPVLHLGYLLAEVAWGQGYATEVLRGVVEAVSARGPALLLAGVDPANPASARVLVKAGFQRDPALSTGPSEMYRLDLP